jgi:succinate dehydrogenase / fumarate reductase membrane anchor subunit
MSDAMQARQDSVAPPASGDLGRDAAERDASAGGVGTVSWLIQVVTGALVLVLVTLHMIANHFIVPGGLRDFQDVVEYLRTPIILVLEVAFLVVVTWHGMLGLRAVLFDLGLSRRAERATTRVLTVVGIATVAYGLWLTAVVIGSA